MFASGEVGYEIGIWDIERMEAVASTRVVDNAIE
jgi:hypothetical protein